MSFENEVLARIQANEADASLREAAKRFTFQSILSKYSYNFQWLGRPIIQYPQDMVAVQELIWQVQPDLIIETGIAHGGSIIMSASLLAQIDYCEALENRTILDPRSSRRKVLGIDIDIRAHNRAAIESHPLAHKIQMIEGSSVDPDVVARVHELARGYAKTLVFLDSMHTHDHVLLELEAYAPLVTRGSYCVVFDTIIEDLPDGFYSDRPWGRGDNPKTAVREYLLRLKEEGRRAADGAPLCFAVDRMIENKLLITVAPEGYLRRV